MSAGSLFPPGYAREADGLAAFMIGLARTDFTLNIARNDCGSFARRSEPGHECVLAQMMPFKRPDLAFTVSGTYEAKVDTVIRSAGLSHGLTHNQYEA